MTPRENTSEEMQLSHVGRHSKTSVITGQSPNRSRQNCYRLVIRFECPRHYSIADSRQWATACERTSMFDTTFKTRFKALTGHEHGPFPWQIELFEKWFTKGEFPHSCNLPTGLGKTLIVAIWLIALMDQPGKIPRRLVYVVNRRTVVDQTTEEVEKLCENLLKLENVPKHVQQVAISTLRGQYADNHEWSADPSRPAVICGTVDMIGSRLLFSGYGVGFKAKPLHAGFLGQDVLVVHDEAHLEPAFQDLLTAIKKEQWEVERHNP